MTRQRLSAHFTVEEFDTHDGTRVPPTKIPELRSLCVHVLEPMRAAFGPISVTSGFRHRAYNRSIGSTDGSYHVYNLRGPGDGGVQGEGGVAADVVPARGTPAEWAAWARAHRLREASLKKRSLGGVGRYDRSGFVHVDTGPRRDWAG